MSLSSSEHGSPHTSQGESIRPYPITATEERKRYHEIRGRRLREVASAAGVVRPDRAREAHELALQDIDNLAKPGEYHIPTDPESPKL